MSVEYELEFRDGGIEFPLGIGTNADSNQLGFDERSQIQEMQSISGPSAAEYGGEYPWIHQWMGSICIDDVVESRRGESFESTVESVVESLMMFFGDGSTPKDTSVDDFEWRVQVNRESVDSLPVGVYTIVISWVPK